MCNLPLNLKVEMSLRATRWERGNLVINEIASSRHALLAAKDSHTPHNDLSDN